MGRGGGALTRSWEEEATMSAQVILRLLDNNDIALIMKSNVKVNMLTTGGNRPASTTTSWLQMGWSRPRTGRQSKMFHSIQLIWKRSSLGTACQASGTSWWRMASSQPSTTGCCAAAVLIFSNPIILRQRNAYQIESLFVCFYSTFSCCKKKQFQHHHDAVFVQLNQYSQILRRQCCLHLSNNIFHSQKITKHPVV